mmetsp:Transcript_22733/g.65540  ORF Transcript_22733/g.65540 Transcript_22733/m.65540 type:complete len:212 (-) Transcript_22733:1053-1688(-)
MSLLPAGAGSCRKGARRHWAAVGRLALSSSILRQRPTANSEASGMAVQGAAGLEFQYLMASRWSVPHMKGREKLRSSKRTTPQLKMSAFGWISPIQTSGAMVTGVPIGLLNLKFPGWKICATPRSITMTCGCSFRFSRVKPALARPGAGALLLGISMMLADLRSRCTMPRACTWAMAIRTWRMTSATKRSGRARWAFLHCLTRDCKSPPEQ